MTKISFFKFSSFHSQMFAESDICLSFSKGETRFARDFCLQIFIGSFDKILENLSNIAPIIVEVIQCLANFFIVGFRNKIAKGIITRVTKSEKNSCKV